MDTDKFEDYLFNVLIGQKVYLIWAIEIRTALLTDQGIKRLLFTFRTCIIFSVLVSSSSPSTEAY